MPEAEELDEHWEMGIRDTIREASSLPAEIGQGRSPLRSRCQQNLKEEGRSPAGDVAQRIIMKYAKQSTEEQDCQLESLWHPQE